MLSSTIRSSVRLTNVIPKKTTTISDISLSNLNMNSNSIRKTHPIFTTQKRRHSHNHSNKHDKHDDDHEHHHSFMEMMFHGHSHSHGEPEILNLTPQQQKKEMEITKWGLYSNILLTFGKFGAGIVGNSAALIADGVHSVSDMLSDAVTMLTIKHSSLPADKEHPYGHGKIEDVGTGVIAGVLIMTGLGIGWSAVDTMMDILMLDKNSDIAKSALEITSQVQANDIINNTAQHAATKIDTVVDSALSIDSILKEGKLGQMMDTLMEGLFGTSHHHGIDPHVPTSIALGMAIFSVLVKEVLFHMTMKVSRETGSKIVAVNAWHHRSDAMSSLIAVVGIGGAMVSLPILDPLAAFVVAGLITKQGWDMGKEVYHNITDRDVDMDVKKKVMLSLNKCAIFGIVGYHGLCGRKMGRYSVLDVNVIVQDRLSVSAAHQVAETVTQQIMIDNALVGQVHVHVDVLSDLVASQSSSLTLSSDGCFNHSEKIISNKPNLPQTCVTCGSEWNDCSESVCENKHLGSSTTVDPDESDVELGHDDVVYVDKVIITRKNIDEVNEAVNRLNEYMTSQNEAHQALTASLHDHSANLDPPRTSTQPRRLMRSYLAVEYDVHQIVNQPLYTLNYRLCVRSVVPHYVNGVLSVDVELGIGGQCAACNSCSYHPDGSNSSSTSNDNKLGKLNNKYSLDDLMATAEKLKLELEKDIKDLHTANVTLKLT